MKNKYINKIKNAEVVTKKINEIFSITATVKIRGKRFTFRPVAVAAILAVIVLIAAIVSSIGSSGTKSVDLGFGAEVSCKLLKSDKNIIAYCNRGAAAVNSKGKIKWKVEKELSEPLGESGGKYFLLADLAGNHFAASYKNGKLMNEYKSGSDIISAKITESGFAAIATDTDGYKGKVTVFNKRGREIYAWNSGSGYITDIALSDNGRYLAVAQLITENGLTDGKVQIIDTSKGETISVAERNGEMPVEVKFVSSNKLVVVTDNHIAAYNRGGKQLFDVSLAGKNPSLYSLNSDDMIGVVTFDNKGNNLLELYSLGGKFKGAYTASGDIRVIDVSGRRAAVAEQKGIVRVTSHGKGKKPVSVEHDIKGFVLFPGGKRAFVTGTSQSECLSLK